MGRRPDHANTVTVDPSWIKIREEFSLWVQMSSVSLAKKGQIRVLTILCNFSFLLFLRVHTGRIQSLIMMSHPANADCDWMLTFLFIPVGSLEL